MLSDSPYNNELLWKRVCLLPTILFIDVGKSRRADLDTKLDLILANSWPFRIGDFPGRMVKPDPITLRDPSHGARSGATTGGVARVIESVKAPTGGA